MKKMLMLFSLAALPLFANAEEELQNQFQESLQGEFLPRGQYTTTHQGAFHRPIDMGILGDWIKLEDGSIWNVAAYDQYKVRRWIGENLFILPNHHFSSYDYCIVNLSTGEIVEVKMHLGPIYHGFNTFTVTAVNQKTGEFMLNDGSLWEVLFTDTYLLKDWHVDDTVVLGINDGWWESTSPNIVINVMLKNQPMRHAFVQCRCIGY